MGELAVIEMYGWVLAVLAAPWLTAWVAFQRFEAKGRAAWTSLPLPSWVEGVQPYRAAPTHPGYYARAPEPVRLAAFACLFVGQLPVYYAAVLLASVVASVEPARDHAPRAPLVLFVIFAPLWSLGRRLLAREPGLPNTVRAMRLFILIPAGLSMLATGYSLVAYGWGPHPMIMLGGGVTSAMLVVTYGWVRWKLRAWGPWFEGPT